MINILRFFWWYGNKRFFPPSLIVSIRSCVYEKLTPRGYYMYWSLKVVEKWKSFKLFSLVGFYFPCRYTDGKSFDDFSIAIQSWEFSSVETPHQQVNLIWKFNFAHSLFSKAMTDVSLRFIQKCFFLSIHAYFFVSKLFGNFTLPSLESQEVETFFVSCV